MADDQVRAAVFLKATRDLWCTGGYTISEVRWPDRTIGLVLSALHAVCHPFLNRWAWDACGALEWRSAVWSCRGDDRDG